MIEKKRSELIQQQTYSWGDLTPNDAAKLGGLPRVTVERCQATYNAVAAQLPASDTTMAPSSSHRLAVPTDQKRVTTQGWSLKTLISSSPNFKHVRRVSALNPTALRAQELEKYDAEGIPIIIENWHKHPNWPKEFNLESFIDNCSSTIDVRNVIDGSDKTMATSEFIDKCRAASPFVSDVDHERLYAKDVECSEKWRDSLDTFGIPSHLLPGKPTDFLSHQPAKVRVKTLMCYVGVGDTFTPCHKDSCASSGQNLMCYTEGGGSSFWFMTATEDAFSVAEYFRFIDQELDHEQHVITVEQLAKAPFPVYITEQVLGDLVLVPSRSCHQVINHGGITIKTSWSRMTLGGLIAANYHELPIYQRVCRAEIYRVKFTIYNAIRGFVQSSNTSGGGDRRRPNSRSVASSFGPVAQQRRRATTLCRLLDVYNDILTDERPHPDFADKLSYVYPLSESSNTGQDMDEFRFICDFCGADIFQSFFECRKCANQRSSIGPDDSCVICSRCYVDGRTCACGEMKAMQCRKFQALEIVRRTGIEVLRKLCRGSKPSVVCEPDRLGTFAAACLRNSLNRQGVVHNSEQYDSIYCTSCQTACSFRHLLADLQTHAVDALLDSTDQVSYHDRYHNSRPKRLCESDIHDFGRSVRDGTRPDSRFQRFHIIAFFRKCLPASQNVQLGYYDEGWDPHVKRNVLANLAAARGMTTASCPPSSAFQLRQQSPAMSLLTELTSENGETQVTDLLTSRKVKRHEIDYIYVPPLPETLAKYRAARCAKHASEPLSAEVMEVSGMSLDTRRRLRTEGRSCGGTTAISTNIDVSVGADRGERNDGTRDVGFSLDVCVDKDACTSEIMGDGSGQHHQDSAKRRKSMHRTAKAVVKKVGGRKAKSAWDQRRRRKSDPVTKHKTDSPVADIADKMDPSMLPHAPRRQVLAKASVEPPLSGDDSDKTIVDAQIPRIAELDGQTGPSQSIPNSRNRSMQRVSVTVHSTPDLDASQEVRHTLVAKRPLDLPVNQSSMNAGENLARPSKRQKLVSTRQEQLEISGDNNISVQPRASSEPDGASLLVNVMNSAWSANRSAPRSEKPQNPRPRNSAEHGDEPVIQDHNPLNRDQTQELTLTREAIDDLRNNMGRVGEADYLRQFERQLTSSTQVRRLMEEHMKEADQRELEQEVSSATVRELIEERIKRAVEAAEHERREEMISFTKALRAIDELKNRMEEHERRLSQQIDSEAPSRWTIDELATRIAELERRCEQQAQQDNVAERLDSIVKKVTETSQISHHAVSQPQPLFYVPISLGKPEGVHFTNDAYVQKGNLTGNQQIGRQCLPHPRDDYRYQQPPTSPRSLDTDARHVQPGWQDRPGRGTGKFFNRKRHIGNRTQVCDESGTPTGSTEVIRYNRWPPPADGPSDTRRHHKQTFGRGMSTRGRWKSPRNISFPSTSRISPSPSHHREHGVSRGEVERHDKQIDQEQVPASWNTAGFASEWDAHLGNKELEPTAALSHVADSEEQDDNWEDDYVQDDGARNVETTREERLQTSQAADGKASIALNEDPSINPWTS